MILVTGGTGLVGAHLLLQLVKEETGIRAIYREKTSLENVKKIFAYYQRDSEELFDRIEWTQANLNDLGTLEQAFDGVTKVYHCAGYISFDPRDFKKLRKINVKGTANMVNLCIDLKVEKLCFVSSIAAIGSSLNGEAVTEETDWSPTNANVYALSKYGAEMEVWRGSQEGLRIVIVNPGVILGPGFWENGSGSVFDFAARGARHYPPGGTGVVSVYDLVNIMIGLMRSNIHSRRYIVIDRNLSYRELLGLITEEFGLKPPGHQIRVWQLEVLWRLDWLWSRLSGRKRKLTKNTVIGLKHPTLYSNEKIKKELDYTFGAFTEAIRFSCRQYRKEYPHSVV